VIESELGEGSCFTVVIPFRLDRQAKAQEKEEAADADITGLRILVAEDNELNMEIAEFVIQSKGASVVKAWNGQEAVEAFEKSASGEFDVILMDVMMPVMNGYEATKTIRTMDRSDAKKIPIIAMTANAFVEDRIKSKEAGMNEHVSKPIDMKLLVKIIAELAEKKEM
jgi:CheY-like chemotaxis protein